MDEIPRELAAIKAAIYTLLGLVVVQITAIYAFLSTVAKSGQGRVIPQLFDLTTRAVKRGVYALDVKLQKRRKSKYKDLQPLPQPFDEAGFRQFCGALLAAVNNAASIEDVKLTEGEWIGNGMTREQFIAYRAKLEEKGVICIKDKRGTRAWRANSNGSYGWARERLEKLAK